MTTLLFITAHPLTVNESRSLQVGEAFLNSWRQNHPQDSVTELNLYQEEVPVLDSTMFNIWTKLKNGISFTSLPEEEQKLLAHYNHFSDQFIAADKYVFVNPMWNHGFPPILKAYIDSLCVAHKTFKYTVNGPIGLLGDKKVAHIQSSGGIYDRSGDNVLDFGAAYLKHMMTFFGIKAEDFKGIYVDGLDAFPEKTQETLEKGKQEAAAVAVTF